MARARPEHILIAEGDELDFSKAQYQILEEPALRAALDGSPIFVRDDDASYGWVAEENESGARRAYGHVRLAGGELILECQSRPRLERGKASTSFKAGGQPFSRRASVPAAVVKAEPPDLRRIRGIQNVQPDAHDPGAREQIDLFMTDRRSRRKRLP